MKQLIALFIFILVGSCKIFSQQYSFKIDGFNSKNKSLLKPFVPIKPYVDTTNMYVADTVILNNMEVKMLPNINVDNMPILTPNEGVVYNMPVAGLTILPNTSKAYIIKPKKKLTK